MLTWKNKDLLKIGWDRTKENFWPLVVFMALVYVASILGREINIGFVVDMLASFVMTSVFLRISRGVRFEWKNIFDDLSGAKLFHYVLSMIIVMIFFVIGLGLLVIPGFIVAIMLSFVTYIIVDENKKISFASVKFWDAIKSSYYMTKGVRWKIFELLVVLLGINILGILALGVGLLVTIPISSIAFAVLYDKLRKNPNEIVIEPIGNNESKQAS